MEKNRPLTLEELQHAYEIAAKVVAKFGDIYLPIFERVHNELENHKQSLSMKSLALKIAHNSESDSMNK